MGEWKTPEELQEFVTSYQRNIKYKEIGSLEGNRIFVQSLDDDDFNYTSIYKALMNFDSEGLLLPKKVKYPLVTLLTEWLQCSDGRYGCPVCKHVYINRVDLARHLTVMHFKLATRKRKKGSESERTCQICFVTLSTKHNLQLHQRTHDGRKDFKCEECDQAFYTKSLLSEHVNTKHTRKKVFPCPFCGKIFYSSNERGGHVITYHQETKPFKCDVCNMTFLRNCYLVTHRLTHFPASFQCLECKKMFRSKVGFLNHSKTHEPEKRRTKLECNFCHKMYVSKKVLNDHISCHTGERAYKCAFCGDRFRLPHHLAQHLKKHTKEKPYPCAICDKAFAIKHQRDNHLQIHKGLADGRKKS